MNLQNLQNRISITNCAAVPSGTVAGRIIHLEAEGLYLSDETGCAFFCGKFPADFNEGDIAALLFENTPEGPVILETLLLTASTRNPQKDPDSLWNKFNKNSGKLQQVLKSRARFFSLIEEFFLSRNFTRVHTPTLVESPGLETYLEPFSTTYRNYGDKKNTLYLPTSPEFALKEALTCGLENIFDIAKSFRNLGENSTLHRPEFYMLEWYRAYAGYETIMDDLEELITFLLDSLCSKREISRKGRTILCSTFKRVTLKELLDPYGINLDLYTKDGEVFRKQILSFYRSAHKTGEDQKTAGLETDLNKEDLFFKFFLDVIEPELGFDKPTIVYEYPLEMTTLSRTCPGNGLYGERFELFIAGTELANAYGELTDPAEQKRRFLETIKKRSQAGKSPLALPGRFLAALEAGIPPCSGIALGVERLLMLILDEESINDVSLFSFSS